MGTTRFDDLARKLTDTGPRRGLVRLVGGLTIGGAVTPWIGGANARAKKKKKQTKPGAAGPAGPPGPPGAPGTGSCPNDTTFFAGAGCVENTVRAEATWISASTTCASVGRRMLTIAELDAFRQQPGVTIGEPSAGNVEWSGTIVSGTSAMTVSEAGNYVLGTISVATLPFRCMEVPAIA
jgi:hypothetical protein